MTNVFWISLSGQFDTKDFKMRLEVMAPESAAAVVVQGLSFQGQRFQFLLFQNQIVFLRTFEMSASKNVTFVILQLMKQLTRCEPK